MLYNPKKEKIVNAQPDPLNDAGKEKDNTIAENSSKDPLAPFDPGLNKSGEPLQSNQDPLNGVNE